MPCAISKGKSRFGSSDIAFDSQRLARKVTEAAYRNHQTSDSNSNKCGRGDRMFASKILTTILAWLNQSAGRQIKRRTTAETKSWKVSPAWFLGRQYLPAYSLLFQVRLTLDRFLLPRFGGYLHSLGHVPFVFPTVAVRGISVFAQNFKLT